jgi:hypothetical protein
MQIMTYTLAMIQLPMDPLGPECLQVMSKGHVSGDATHGERRKPGDDGLGRGWSGGRDNSRFKRRQGERQSR